MLSVEQLHAWYGKSAVLRGVSLRVQSGEVVALLGRNGAGRSTVLKAIMGQVVAHGSVLLDGTELSGLQSFEIARRGVGYVPEDRAIFKHLSVEQNLMLGEQRGAGTTPRTLADMYRMFEALGRRRHVAAGLLSGGEQQMLALSRTLMGNPRWILVDEPTEGLAPALVEQVAMFLRQLACEGVGILLVEQKLDMALEIADRVVLMGHGAIVFQGTPAQLRAAPQLCEEWLQV